VTVAVLDAGGQVKVLKREDGCSLLRPEIATGKAWGTLGTGFGGREIARRAAKRPGFYAALPDLSAGRMVPVPGGVRISSPIRATETGTRAGRDGNPGCSANCTGA